jgi:hypothetical protein
MAFVANGRDTQSSAFFSAGDLAREDDLDLVGAPEVQLVA